MKYLSYACAAAMSVCLCACIRASNSSAARPAIVGTWLVKMPEAPFPYHMMTFHADGTVQQSNPDAGDPRTSDSAGMGSWVAEEDRIKGKFVEVTADRTTRQFVSRGEISFALQVKGDTLSGTASANFHDAHGQRVGGPIAATMEGQRVLP